ncbi:MAG: sigma-70 family RNA polymerase sigma factor [candidate division Zixibacteria bacterium]|nr:sigma-70 family RNA polymerase sigma factor [candidate division Zixibacteria bacterium]
MQGDAAAWEGLVRRYASLVYSVARHVGLPRGDAEDCAQQTWLALYRGRDKVKDPNKLPAWLASVARRKAVRMQLRRRNVEDRHRALQRPQDVAAPDEEIMRLQQAAQLDLAIEQLDERCRRLIEAIFLLPKTMTYREIADALDMPINSLGPTRQRCLVRLKEILTKIENA